MTKFIQYQSSLKSTAFVQNQDQNNITEDRITNSILISTFQELASTAEGYISYNNNYGYSDEWNITTDLFLEINQLLNNAFLACIHHANLVTGDEEFLKMARAGVRAMNHKDLLSPMEILQHRFPSGPLPSIYHREQHWSMADLTFVDLAESAIGATTIVSFHRSFRKFCDLPAEIRAEIIHEYLLLERDEHRLGLNRHYCSSHRNCCTWNYPHELIVCDLYYKFGLNRYSKDWFPNLAFVSHSMNEEVAIHMLQRTKCFIFTRKTTNNYFNCANWFHGILSSLPNDCGLNAVRFLDFRDMHSSKYVDAETIPNNPSIDLAVACKNLSKLAMGFSDEELAEWNEEDQTYDACPLASIIDDFKLESILECAKLEELYMYELLWSNTTACLEALRNLAKWVMIRSLIERYPERGIQVKIVPGSVDWKDLHLGVSVTLDADDMEKVMEGVQFKNIRAPLLALSDRGR